MTARIAPLSPRVISGGPELAVIARLNERDLLEIVDAVARERHVSRGDICGRDRTKAVAGARHEVWSRIRATTSLSYPEIARLFGGHHTTVMAGVRKCAALASKAAVG